MTQPSFTIDAKASLNVRAIVLPRAEWETSVAPNGMPALRPQKGTWYGHVVRGRDSHDVRLVPLIGCPNCNGLLFLATEQSTPVLRMWTGRPLPVVHHVDPKGKVSPDILCEHGRCDFHRTVYLDRWLKTKPLWAIAFVQGNPTVQIEYTNAIDQKEALFHFNPRARKGVKILGVGRAVGFYVNEKTGRVTTE